MLSGPAWGIRYQLSQFTWISPDTLGQFSTRASLREAVRCSSCSQARFGNLSLIDAPAIYQQHQVVAEGMPSTRTHYRLQVVGSFSSSTLSLHHNHLYYYLPRSRLRYFPGKSCCASWLVCPGVTSIFAFTTRLALVHRAFTMVCRDFLVTMRCSRSDFLSFWTTHPANSILEYPRLPSTCILSATGHTQNLTHQFTQHKPHRKIR